MQVRPADWFAASGYALLNWAFDIACLVACAAALHVPGLTLPLVLVAYTAGMATSGLSPLPGGSGSSTALSCWPSSPGVSLHRQQYPWYCSTA